MMAFPYSEIKVHRNKIPGRILDLDSCGLIIVLRSLYLRGFHLSGIASVYRCLQATLTPYVIVNMHLPIRVNIIKISIFGTDLIT